MRAPALWAQSIATALALLGLHAAAAHGSKSGSDAALAAAAQPAAGVCESRTINYITHSLPQQCLRTSWTSPAPATSSAAADPTTTTTPEAPVSTAAPPASETPKTATATRTTTTTTTTTAAAAAAAAAAQDNGTPSGQDQDAHEDLAASSFMSFEEWKEMMLRKSGQDPANIRAHRQREHRGGRDPGLNSGDLDSFGEDGEISLDFDALSEKVSELASSPSGAAAANAKQEAKEQHVLYDDGKTQYYRSKDAGKTCKERFSYSSFDAGATVLKTSPGAKNAKAILVENKDSYMLLECRAKNKFVIVELSDDILVDTIVLANFEFFSSMIRKFRVSASDRYPVKTDKWVELGTFEARNSRDIQAFLVEHPQIYARYIRIEFLSHYGNEFYCPVSLLRVHGTRMLDTWKEPAHDDEPEQIPPPEQEPAAQTEQVQEPPTTGNSSATAIEEKASDVAVEMGLSPWPPVFPSSWYSLEVCPLHSPTAAEPAPIKPGSGKHVVRPAGGTKTVTARPSAASTAHEVAQSANSAAADSSVSPTAQGQAATAATPVSSPATPHVGNDSTAGSPSQKQSDARTDAADASSSSSSSTPTATTSRNRTSSASSSPSPSPTVQESFFKAVNKRLQLLESNTSLSLQYIEDQSRFLQEVLLKMERKHITRVDTFLDSLNKTVFSELRNVRTQYDQIWQSTVIALETQREQSQREIVALTSRLNVLADEVVFQKRMAILQSVLLLACLVLVIFSRGGLAALDNASFPTAAPFPPSPRRHNHYHHTTPANPAAAATNGRDSLSGSPSSPVTGGGGTAATGYSEATTLAPSASDPALVRHLYAPSFRDKALPMTPTTRSDFGGETPPSSATHDPGSNKRPESFYREDEVQARQGEDEDDELKGEGQGKEERDVSKPETAEQHARPRSPDSGSILPSPTPTTRTGEKEEEENGDDENRFGSMHQHQQALYGEKEGRGSLPHLRTRSSLGQLGGGLRKPLPALPEDPT